MIERVGQGLNVVATGEKGTETQGARINEQSLCILFIFLNLHELNGLHSPPRCVVTGAHGVAVACPGE